MFALRQAHRAARGGCLIRCARAASLEQEAPEALQVPGGHGIERERGYAGVTGRMVSPVTSELWERRQKMKRMMEDLNGSGELVVQEVLIPKPPVEQEMVYPFSSNEELVEQYRNPWGFVRLGRLLEDLDSLAGNIAYNHCDDGNPKTMPLLIVTAGVDRIRLDHPLSFASDMTLAGKVVYTGRTSMEIRMTIADMDGVCLRANFHFVARDPITGKGAPVNPVAPETEGDKKLHQLAEARAALTKQARKTPESPEQAAAREQFKDDLLRAAVIHQEMPSLAPGDAVLMDQTNSVHNFICQPQYRNMHNRIFGGFLMRRAFEVAFTTAYSHSGTRPSFVEVGDISFKRPVDVGDMLSLRADVLSAGPEADQVAVTSTQEADSCNIIRVQVIASVRKPEARTSMVTNTLDFTFATSRTAADGSPLPLKRVLPDNEADAERVWRALNKVKGKYGGGK